MSGPVEIVLIVAAVGYVLVRRYLGEPAQVKRALVLPAVLSLIGLQHIGGALHSPAAVGFVAATVALGVLFGLLRGASVRLFQRDGIVFMRYTAVTFVVWVASFAVKFGSGYVFGLIDPGAAAAAGNTTMLSLGIGLLAEGVVVLAKAVRTGDQVIWSKGRRGAAHQTSPWFDDLQRRFTERDGTRR